MLMASRGWKCDQPQLLAGAIAKFAQSTGDSQLVTRGCVTEW